MNACANVSHLRVELLFGQSNMRFHNVTTVAVLLKQLESHRMARPWNCKAIWREVYIDLFQSQEMGVFGFHAFNHTRCTICLAWLWSLIIPDFALPRFLKRVNCRLLNWVASTSFFKASTRLWISSHVVVAKRKNTGTWLVIGYLTWWLRQRLSECECSARFSTLTSDCHDIGRRCHP